MRLATLRDIKARGRHGDVRTCDSEAAGTVTCRYSTVLQCGQTRVPACRTERVHVPTYANRQSKPVAYSARIAIVNPRLSLFAFYSTQPLADRVSRARTASSCIPFTLPPVSPVPPAVNFLLHPAFSDLRLLCSPSLSRYHGLSPSSRHHRPAESAGNPPGCRRYCHRKPPPSLPFIPPSCLPPHYLNPAPNRPALLLRCQGYRPPRSQAPVISQDSLFSFFPSIQRSAFLGPHLQA